MLELPEHETSLWRETYTTPIYPALEHDIEVDVAIVGAGITGLTTGYLLKRAGLRVAIVDKSSVGGGTTGRTTGKVTAQHNCIYMELQKRHGNSVARSYAQANAMALDLIAQTIQKEHIDCDWQVDDNYVFTRDPKRSTEFKQEAKAAAALGLPASFETKTPLPFDIEAAVKFSHQGKMNAQKYLLGLARAVEGDGSYIFERSAVTSIHDGLQCVVKTRAAAILASHIVVATNVPTFPLAARATYCAMEYPRESYIVAGNLPAAKQTGMYISPDATEYSILPITVAGKHKILVGGNSHISGLRGNKQARYQKLAEYAQKHFGVTEITHRWSDRDYLAYDDIPLVGKLYPWSRNLYVATAFHKWGLTNGTAAAMILSDTIQGTENPWAHAFDSLRLKPITSIPHAIRRSFS
jgi:glycine/D-amino acid oxidase-like deaminating enzyme